MLGRPWRLKNWGNDDDVVKHGIGRHALLFHEPDNEVVQVFGHDGVDRGFGREVFEKTFQHRPVLAQRVRLLEGFDLAEVSGDRHVERSLPPLFARVLKTLFPKLAAVEIVLFAPLGFERLGGGNTGRSAPALPGQIPLNVITPIRESAPVGIAFAGFGDGEQAPALAILTFLTMLTWDTDSGLHQDSDGQHGSPQTSLCVRN